MSNPAPTPAIEVIGPRAGEVLNVLGAPITVKSGGDARQLFFADHPLPPGYGVPMHVHLDDDELFYVLEGELTLLSPDGELKAGPGTFVHLPCGAAHGFLNATDTPGRMLVITTPGGNLEGVFRDLDAAKSPAPEEVGAICAAHRIPMV